MPRERVVSDQLSVDSERSSDTAHSSRVIPKERVATEESHARPGGQKMSRSGGAGDPSAGGGSDGLEMTCGDLAGLIESLD